MTGHTPAHILVVDDDASVRRMLRGFLEGEGFATLEATDAISTASALAKHKIDLITLDLNLGTVDGLTIAREIRQSSDVPIIMVTGKGDTIDRIVGLEVGADDYIPKPFHLREVLARVRSVLRRRAQTSQAPGTPEEGNSITFDDFVLDLGRRTLKGPEGAVELTSGEFDMLVMFAYRPHRVLSRDQIMDLLKGNEWAPMDRSIDNRVARLRKKIEPDPANPILIKTVRGAGYSFTPKEIS